MHCTRNFLSFCAKNLRLNLTFQPLSKMVMNPKNSGKYIAGLATHVKINHGGIEKLGKELINELKSGKLCTENFSQHDIHPKSTDSWAVDWIFVVDTLNFCFWKPENEIGWKVDGYTGYFALCAAVKRAQKEGIDITNPRFYSTITEAQLSQILRSESPISVPLLKERVACLHEVGKTLIEKFNGTFLTCLKQAENSSVKLLSIIVENFPCFRDEATYKGEKVAIYKRAQILVGDIWACYNGKDLGAFEDIESMAMFADYRVPQSLIYYGVFEYSNELNELLKSNTLLENGSEMEVEIRGCSIHAVELLKDWVVKNSNQKYNINSILIDHFLWDFRRKHAEEILKMGIPFHKTYSIYY